jgi:hypothetical protein
MIVVHRIFRREARLLPRLGRSVPAGDVARAKLVAAHFRDYHLGPHEHHTGEDDLLWPLLLARVDLEAELVLRMEVQHEKVAGTLADVEKLLPEWEATASPAVGERITEALAAHSDALHEHLDDEERYVLALVEEHISAAEWNRLGERFTTETPKDKLLFFLGAILEEATPQERAAMLGNLPVLARIIWYVVGRAQYARRIRKVRSSLR